MDSESIFRDLPTIETPRLILRKLRLDDAADVFAYCSDPDVARFTSWRPHESLEQSGRFIEWALGRHNSGQPVPWGIQHKVDGIIIGTCGFDPGWIIPHARAEIGYALARRYWNQGYMTEAVREAIAFGFRAMRLNRIEAVCNPENVGSWRVMEKTGMRREGILRQRKLIKGRYVDDLMYSILRHEWLERRSKPI